MIRFNFTGGIFLTGLLVLIMSCGSTIKIAPAPKSTGNVVAPVKDTLTVVKDTLPPVPAARSKVKVALILPLQLDKHFEEDTVPDDAPLILPEALPALNFLEGARLAQAYLAGQSLDMEFTIVDAGFDSSATEKKLSSEKFQQVDAIVSLLPPNYNQFLSANAGLWKKPLYLFYSPNVQLLEHNPYIHLAYPSNITQIRQTALFLAENYSASNFIAVSRDQRREKEIASLFASVIDSVTGKPCCKSLNYTVDGWPALKSKLVKNKRNLLILPTADESFLTALLNKISEVKNEYGFMLCGIPGWENFNAVDPVVMKEMNAVFFNGMYIDIENVEVIAFRKKFISEYHADPLLQAYMAYDVLTLIASQRPAGPGGKVIPYAYLLSPSKKTSGLVPLCDDCGKERNVVNIIRYDDYKFVLLN